LTLSTLLVCGSANADPIAVTASGIAVETFGRDAVVTNLHA
jgi:hypothetical protein